MQHRQQHGQTVLIQPHRHPPGVTQLAVIHQGLHLHQQRAAALPGHHHDTAGNGLLVAGQKNSRGIAHFPQALVRHGEHTQLIDGTKAILHRPDHTEAVVLLAFKIEHAVHHMLQHPRPGQGAFLGDMPHQEQGGAGLLGETHQCRSTFAHLRHAARSGAEPFGINGLDGVHHHHPGFFPVGGGQDVLDAGFRHQAQLVHGQVQAPGPQGHLLQGFFPGDVERGLMTRQMSHGLQQNGGFADTRIAADQHHGALHQTAAQDPVQLTGAGGGAGFLHQVDLRHGGDLTGLPGPAGLATPVGGHATIRVELRKSVPGTAIGTLPRPLGEYTAAIAADKLGFCLGH